MYKYTSPASLKRFTIAPAIPDFHPLGIAFDASTSKLYAINHSRFNGSVIEIFALDASTATLHHERTFKHPLLHAPNAMHILGGGKMYITNDHYITAAVSPVLNKIETFSNVPGGSVVFIDLKFPETDKIVARVGFANGLAKINQTTLAVASTAAPGIVFFDIQANYDLVRTRIVRTPAAVDNLSVDGKGRVLAAGHPFAPRLMGVSKRRPGCVEGGEEACRCDSPSWAGEWSEEGGLKTLLADGGESVCSSSTVVRDVKRGVGIVSMLYGRGIVVFED
jgi:arylesterase/paraoxonase